MGLVFGRVAPQDVAGDLDGGTDNGSSEEPGAVPDDGLVEKREEDYPVQDGGEDRQGERWRVHPDDWVVILVVSHPVGVVGAEVSELRS